MAIGYLQTPRRTLPLGRVGSSRRYGRSRPLGSAAVSVQVPSRAHIFRRIHRPDRPGVMPAQSRPVLTTPAPSAWNLSPVLDTVPPARHQKPDTPLRGAYLSRQSLDKAAAGHPPESEA